MEEIFDVYVVGTPIRKPRPEPYREALQHCNVRPAQAVMIGDRYLTDILGARLAGLYTVLVNPLDPHSEPFGNSLARELEKLFY